MILRAMLNDGYDFDAVIAALNQGLSSNYVDGHYGEWITAEKQTYRAAASGGLRFAIMVHSIVPNSYHPDGHGLFMTHDVVVSSVPEAESWAMILAGLGIVGFALRKRVN